MLYRNRDDIINDFGLNAASLLPHLRRSHKWDKPYYSSAYNRKLNKECVSGFLLHRRTSLYIWIHKFRTMDSGWGESEHPRQREVPGGRAETGRGMVWNDQPSLNTDHPQHPMWAHQEGDWREDWHCCSQFGINNWKHHRQFDCRLASHIHSNGECSTHHCG